MRVLSGFRSGLLGTGAFGALSIALALSATSPAQAACTPTASGAASGTQTCTGANSGTSYTATGGDLTVNLNNAPFTGSLFINDDGSARAITVNDGSATQIAAAITSADATGYVVELFSTGGNVSFTSVKGGTIAYTGTANAATLFGGSTLGGNVTLTTGDTITNSSASGNGIQATVTNGALVINAGGNITAKGSPIFAQAFGTGAITIKAGSASAPVNLTTSNDLTTGAVMAQGGSGAINITTWGNLAGDIEALATSGAVTVTANGNITQRDFGGIIAESIGDGNILVNANGGTIDNSTVVDVTPGSSLAEAAIVGVSSGAGNIAINLGDGEILRSAIAGVDAIASTGTVTVTEGKNTQIFAKQGTATVNVLNIGPTNLLAGVGIYGISNQTPASAATTVAITTGSGDAITMTGDNTAGIAGLNAGSGKGGVAISVGDNNTITSTGGDNVFGVAAVTNNTTPVTPAFSGNGNVSISLGNNDVISLSKGDGAGGVLGYSAGLYAVSGGGNVAITTGTGGSISVKGTSNNPTYGIYGLTTGTGAVTITNGSSITVNNGPAIFASTGSGAVSVVNNGTINGLISVTTTGSAGFNNKGTWALPPGSNTLPALISVSNSGLIDLHGANAAAGDKLTIAGAYSGGGQISLDAALGSDASGSACGALADCLQLASSTGVTSIIVNNTLTAAQAGLNSGGILLVNGASHAGDFVLDPSSPNYNGGTIVNGLVGYSLAYGSNQVRLVGGASPLAAYAPTLIGAVAQVFYSTDPSSARLSQLDDAATPQGGNDPSTGIWVNGGVTFGHNSSTASLGTGAGAVTVSTGYQQHNYEFSVGGDLAYSGAFTDTDTLIVGGLVGVVGSDVAFSGPLLANAHVGGAQLGAYAGWLDQGWFVNANVIADLMSLGYNYNGAALLTSHPSVNAVGLNAEAGRQFMLNDTFYVEPSASLSYATIHGDDAASGSATLHLGTNESVRGGVGLRVGSDIKTDKAIIDLSLSGRGVDEFDNQENAALLMGGTTLPLAVRGVGSYGEIVASMKVLGTDNGLTGFINGTLDVNSSFNQFTMAGGLRYSF